MPDSLPDPFDPKDIVRLRDVFRRTGMLHDLQLFNLKYWPLVAFPMAKKAKAVVNFEERDISFELDVPWYKRTPDARARAKGLNESVQFLLGPDFRILVAVNGKAIFTGERAAPVVTGDYAGTDFEAGRVVPQTPWIFPKKS